MLDYRAIRPIQPIRTAPPRFMRPTAPLMRPMGMTQAVLPSNPGMDQGAPQLFGGMPNRIASSGNIGGRNLPIDVQVPTLPAQGNDPMLPPPANESTDPGSLSNPFAGVTAGATSGYDPFSGATAGGTAPGSTPSVFQPDPTGYSGISTVGGTDPYNVSHTDDPNSSGQSGPAAPPESITTPNKPDTEFHGPGANYDPSGAQDVLNSVGASNIAHLRSMVAAGQAHPGILHAVHSMMVRPPASRDNNFMGAKSFAQGGAVSAISGLKLNQPIGDTQPAMLDPTEVVFNPHQLSALTIAKKAHKKLRPDQIAAIKLSHAR